MAKSRKIMSKSLGVLKIPIFLIRWVNAAIIRFGPSYLITGYVFSVVLKVTKDTNTLPEVVLIPSLIASIVWGFLFVVSTPSVIGKAYIYKDYPLQIKSIISRKTCMWIIYVILLALGFIYGTGGMTSVVFFGYCIFAIVELSINTMITVFISSRGYNQFLEELYFKKSAYVADKTLVEIYNGSGLKTGFSKDGIKQSVVEIQKAYTKKK